MSPSPAVQVKICGINAPDALRAASEAGADWVGFVFYPPSPRALTVEQARTLHSTLPDAPPAVGLFVAPSEDEIEAVLAAVPLAALQVYAPAERARALRARFGLPVWHGIGVERANDLPAAAPGLDRLLLDAKPAPDAILPGGNAHPFDWPILRGWTSPLPWLLAGGLTPDNVAEAIRESGARAVDVSSGVERARGVKDPAMIRAFIAAAKGAGPLSSSGTLSRRAPTASPRQHRFGRRG